MTTRPWKGAFVGVLITALLVAPSGATASNEPKSKFTNGSSAKPAWSESATSTVTLVTGDKVTFNGRGEFTIAHDLERAGINFTTMRRADGHLIVIPSDAAQLLASGAIDQNLFDVTAVAQQGGEPALLVTYKGRESDAAAKVKQAGAKVVRSIPAVRTIAVDKPAKGLWKQLKGGAISGIWLDPKLKVSLKESVPMIGAPAAWQAGLQGNGITVGVIDTGVDSSHQDLVGTVVQARSFVGGSALTDTIGHGTHVASTIVSGGATYQGVAPEAKLVVAKVCVAHDNCPGSAILEAMQWVASSGANVANMSLGGQPTIGIDPLEQAINDLTEQYGTLFVVSAGNSGLDESVGSPATAAKALAVGAVDKSGNLAPFSSRGPNPEDDSIKPDVAAPGVGIVAAASPSGPSAPAQHVSMDGTSMAAPHVAGAAAILAQQHPQWTAAQIKAALMGSAFQHGQIATTAQGAGRVQVNKAIEQTTLADPPSVTFGQVTPGSLTTRTFTYHNTSNAAVTLGLQAIGKDPSGGLAPAGMFTLNSDTVTVPAGGSANVTLTASVPADAEGYYSGFVYAVSGWQSIVTPFGVRSDQRHTLTLRFLDRAGQPASVYEGFVLDPTGRPHLIAVNVPGGVVSARIPRGVYTIGSLVQSADRNEGIILRVPRFRLDADREFTFDARTAHPVRVTVPDASAQPVFVEFTGQWEVGDHALALGTMSFNQNVYSGLVYEDPTIGNYRMKVGATLAVAGPDGTILNAPRVFNVAWYDLGAWPVGFDRSVPAGNLATVRSHYARQVSGSTGYAFSLSQPSQTFFNFSFGYGLPVTLPLTRDVFFNTEGGVQWSSEFSEYTPDNRQVVHLGSPLLAYTGGSSRAESWNRPVYSPQPATPTRPADWVIRLDNRIGGFLPLWGDADGHYGFSELQDASVSEVRLSRNGQLIGVRSSWPSRGDWIFPVPREYGSYRLEATAVRGAPATLGTRTTVTWTFNSGYVDDVTFIRQPLWSVRLAPVLDDNGAAPAGGQFAIPVTLAAPPNTSVSGIRSVTVEYSTNDGTTWMPATVSGSGTAYNATVTHPAGSGFVSLRVTASDWSGNSVEQTLIGAYRIG